MPRIKNIFLPLTIFLLVNTPSWCQVKYYTPENIYRFAEYLYKSGDYRRAAGEFQRYFFSVEASELSDSLLYKIGLCYELSNETRRAENYYNKIIANYPDSDLFDAARYQIAHTYFRSGKYNESINYIEENIRKTSTRKARFKMDLLIGANYLYKRRWRMANKKFSPLIINDKECPDNSIVSKLNQFSIKGIQLPYKSKILAGSFSAVIPGMGKVYAGRISDGLYSLLVVGLTSWQAYDGFSKGGTKSEKGWIFGTLSAVFYLGNIYGSMVSVKLYNEKIEDDLLNKIDINLIWR
jgi:tetratricopeptide (TPR) repeat protein